MNKIKRNTKTNVISEWKCGDLLIKLGDSKVYIQFLVVVSCTVTFLTHLQKLTRSNQIGTICTNDCLQVRSSLTKNMQCK